MCRPHDDKSESDVAKDDKIASSRAGKDREQHGTYVGRTFPDDAIDAGETGAEARSTDSG